jgi:5'-AMP-activated protein kinase regulatory beta subunit
MGNVNGREEDFNGTVSEISSEEDGGEREREGGFDTVSSDCMSTPDGVVENPSPSELMGHSPPASPRTTQSPLMFSPQVC